MQLTGQPQAQHRSEGHPATMSDTQPTSAQPPGPPAERFRDRVFRFRAVLAVAVAGVLLGGLGGFGLHAATDGGSDDRMGRFGPGQRPGGGGPGFGGGQAGLPGGPQDGLQGGQNGGQGQQLPQPPQGAPTQAPSSAPSASAS
jgi:hypothetical protein